MMGRILTLFALLTGLTGCATYVPSDPKFAQIDESQLPAPDLVTKIPGLVPCTTNVDTSLRLNSTQPVNIMVHGCFGSAALFRSLAQVFAFHGQQAICFTYNDRDSLNKSSAELIAALDALSEKLQRKEITVIGHSQGGLISRRALVRERDDHFADRDTKLRLVTVSAPFAGIAAANHCASPVARALTLGVVVPLCKLISGDKWYEITHPSPFIQQPGKLIDQVSKHFKIVTEERGTCRRFNENNECVEDDYVFSVQEQYFKHVDGSPKVDNTQLAAGHVEIVGDYQVVPVKLINLMQTKGIMRKTTLDRQADLQALLARLYGL